jgi:hypothetical protein
MYVYAEMRGTGLYLLLQMVVYDWASVYRVKKISCVLSPLLHQLCVDSSVTEVNERPSCFMRGSSLFPQRLVPGGRD